MGKNLAHINSAHYRSTTKVTLTYLQGRKEKSKCGYVVRKNLDFDKADSVGSIYVRTIKAAEVKPVWYSGAYRFPLAVGTLKQPLNLSLPKERNRQARAVLWEDTTVDEVVPDDGELEIEEVEDISRDPSIGPGTPTTPSAMTKSQAKT